MSTKKEMTRRQFLALPLPVGKIEMKSSSCTGCGLCTLDCPTGALSFNYEKVNYQLLFLQKSCIGCGQCLKTCPEGCLSLSKMLETESIADSPKILFEDSLVLCRECGTPVAPRAMIDKLSRKLNAKTHHLELCPDCRLALVRR